MEFQGRGDRDFLWSYPPIDLLFRLAVNVLYCPFGATFMTCPGIPTLSTVVDLLHLDYPEGLTWNERTHRSNYFTQMALTADSYQCISDYGAKKLSESYNIDPDRIIRTHLIIADRLKLMTRKKNDSPHPFFFYPANFWPHKNHLTLLVAYAHYLSVVKSNAWDLVLTGFDSSETKSIMKTTETLGISDHVRYEGHVSETRLHEIWSSSSALVFPSLHEGFGIPLVEAMAYRLPIICGQTTCLREVAGDAAIFVDAANPVSVAVGMVRITEDHSIRKQLSENSAEQFKRFSFDREMEKLAEKIEELNHHGTNRSVLKGISKNGIVGKEISFSHQIRGQTNVHAHFENKGMNASVCLRCGDRRFGSWELISGEDTKIEVQIFCDGAPCILEFTLEDNAEEIVREITLKSLEVAAFQVDKKIEIFKL
jgi:glycosyltransferase involved in cell wall biosynthesis